jgi:predicted esterase
MDRGWGVALVRSRMLGILLGSLVACRTGGPVGAPDAASGPALTDQPEEPAREASGGNEASEGTDRSSDGESGEPSVLELPIESGFPLLVWAPRGPGPFPLVIAAHGAGCVAEDHCAYWWRLTEGRAIVACLRGEPLFRNRPEQGFFFRDHLALGRELALSVGALRNRFGDRIGPRATFAGYSQGATMGALALPDSGLTFEQLVFIEGGGEGMTKRSVDRLREQGTKRVLFVCGTGGCSKRAQSMAGVLTRAGIDARAVDAPGVGHTYLGPVEELTRAQTAWLWP